APGLPSTRYSRSAIKPPNSTSSSPEMPDWQRPGFAVIEFSAKGVLTSRSAQNIAFGAEATAACRTAHRTTLLMQKAGMMPAAAGGPGFLSAGGKAPTVSSRPGGGDLPAACEYPRSQTG